MENNFNVTQTILQKSMNANTLRWNVLSNNIANANTPNFKRSDVKFTAQLNRALQSNQNPYPFEAARTDDKHIPFHEKIDYRKVMPKINTEFDSTIFNNGNNVDVENEMAEASKTVLLYEASASLLNRNFNKINILLK